MVVFFLIPRLFKCNIKVS